MSEDEKFDDRHFLSKNKKGEWIIVRRGDFSSAFSNDFDVTREVGKIVTIEDVEKHLNQLEQQKLFWQKFGVLSGVIIGILGLIIAFIRS